MVAISLRPSGPFSLESAAELLMGFTPASGGAAIGPEAGRLTLGFRLDRTYEAVGVSLVQREAEVLAEIAGTSDVERAEAQIARILSIDHDGSTYAAIGARDPVIGALFARYRHLRPVCFGSPWEAAAWGILAQRVPMRVAAGVKRRIAEEHGDIVSIAGHGLAVFPGPARVLSIESAAGLSPEKLARLKAAAEAALEGRLDAERLRAMPVEEAIADLERIRGVGAWTAAHILVRGAGTTDELPLSEPRVLRAIAHAYGLPHTPSEPEARRIAEAWRPFRTWVSVLLAVHLSRTGAWTHSGDARGKKVGSKPSAARKRV